MKLRRVLDGIPYKNLSEVQGSDLMQALDIVGFIHKCIRYLCCEQPGSGGLRGLFVRFQSWDISECCDLEKKCLVIRVGIYLLKASNLFIPRESIVKFICIHHFSQKLKVMEYAIIIKVHILVLNTHQALKFLNRNYVHMLMLTVIAFP